MSGHWCEVCALSHDTCGLCGAAVVASLYLHRKMDAHRSSPHACGADNPGYQAMVRAMRNDYDESREMLTECPLCQDDVIRRANSPVLYDVHGFYGLLGETAVHQCLPAFAAPAPTPRTPSIERPATPALAEVGMEIPR